MGGSIYGKFSDQNSTVLSGQVQTSNNNQITLNAAIAENDHLRSTIAALQPLGLTITPGENVPNVSGVVQSTIGAALAGIGQAGTASQEPGGGGHPCFISNVMISTPDGETPIYGIEPKDMVLAFDAEGKRVPKRVTDKFIHLVDEFTLVTFTDGRTTGLIEDHKYWQRGDIFVPIKYVSKVWHWEGQWKEVAIAKREVIVGEVLVYNFTVSDLHTYIANGDACSNLKPLDPNDEG